MYIIRTRRFFSYISSTKQLCRLNQQIEGNLTPTLTPKVVRARLEKVTHLCTRSDYYVVVSHSQTTFARRKNGLKAVWLRETNYVVGLYHCAGRPFRRILLLTSSTGSCRQALPQARPQCFTVIFCTGIYVHRVTYGCTNERMYVRVCAGSPTEWSILFHGYLLTCFFLCHSHGQSLILCTKKMKYFKDDSQQQLTRDFDIAP